MQGFKEIKPEEMQKDVFTAIGKDWLLVAAQKDGVTNAMTASWGGMGVIWGSDVVYIFVRKSRYTKEFIDASDTFSLSLLDPQKYRKVQSYYGTVSGRDEDKNAVSGLTVVEDGGITFFEESDTVVLCQKMACFPMPKEGFIAEGVEERWYADQDWHDMYVGKIEKVLIRE